MPNNYSIKVFDCQTDKIITPKNLRVKHISLYSSNLEQKKQVIKNDLQNGGGEGEI